MRLVYRLILPAEEITLVYPHLCESNTFLEFASLGTPDTGLLPQFWAYGSDRERLTDRLADASTVSTLTQKAVCSDRVRYAVEWDTNSEAVTELGRLTTLLRDLEVTVLFGRITPAEWVCVLQFPTQEALLRFYTDCEYASCRLTQHDDLDFATHRPEYE